MGLSVSICSVFFFLIHCLHDNLHNLDFTVVSYIIDFSHLKCVIFSVFTKLHSDHHNLILAHYHLKKKVPYVFGGQPLYLLGFSDNPPLPYAPNNH